MLSADVNQQKIKNSELYLITFFKKYLQNLKYKLFHPA